MNFLNTTLLQGRARFSRTLLFGLLAALAVVEARAVSLPQRIFARSGEPRSTVVATSEAVGYLASVGPIPLRFSPPPPEPVERPAPVVATPPVLPAPASETTVQPVAPAVAPAAEPAGTAETATPGAQLEKPVTILPDDTQRDVRAEDFLPYFELPRGANGRSGAPAPFTPAGPPVQPPSSATYQQK